MIQSLQSLRGIFAILIFLHHYIMNGQPAFVAGGDVGVCFFIILSGFVLSASYYDKVLSPNFAIRPFIKKRISRLYPLHFVGFIIALLLYVDNDIPIKPALANLLLVHAWIPSDNYYFTFNSVSWSLSVLLFCYLAFPGIVKIIEKPSLKALILLCAVLLSIYGLVIATLPENYILPIGYISPIMRIVDFGIGVLLYKAYASVKSNNGLPIWSTTRATIMQLTAIVAIAGALALYGQIPLRLAIDSYWWIPCSILILVFSITDSNNTIISRLLHHRILLWFGAISFDFYILHQLIIRGWSKFAISYNLQDGTLTIMTLLFLAAVALAFIANSALKFPLKKNIKALLLRRIN